MITLPRETIEQLREELGKDDPPADRGPVQIDLNPGTELEVSYVRKSAYDRLAEQARALREENETLRSRVERLELERK